MTNQAKQQGRMNVVGCGGGGTNVVSRLEKLTEINDPVFSKITTAYIDTSRSNEDRIPRSKLNLIEARDGSGQKRTENSSEIMDSIPSIAHSLPQADVTIAVSSGGGGSGSVIAPLLVRFLMERKQPVIVFLVGSAMSLMDAKNTLSTIASYEGLVEANQMPLTLVYLQNSATMSRSEVDQAFFDMISALSMLYSRNNREMDTQDLRHLLSYDKVTAHGPQLTVLNIVGNDQSVGNIGNLISLATLIHGDMDSSFNGQRADYHTIGYVQSDDVEVVSKLPLHFAITDGILHDVAAELEEVIKESANALEVRKPKKSISSSVAGTRDKSGLVF